MEVMLLKEDYDKVKNSTKTVEEEYNANKKKVLSESSEDEVSDDDDLSENSVDQYYNVESESILDIEVVKVEIETKYLSDNSFPANDSKGWEEEDMDEEESDVTSMDSEVEKIIRNYMKNSRKKSFSK